MFSHLSVHWGEYHSQVTLPPPLPRQDQEYPLPPPPTHTRVRHGRYPSSVHAGGLSLPPASEEWGKVLFSVCQFTPRPGGGVPYPSDLGGGVPPSQVWTGGIPHPADWGGGVPPFQVWTVGLPHPADGGEIPPSKIRMGGTPMKTG